MSWQANRFKKGSLANARKSRNGHAERVTKRHPTHRTDEGQLLFHLTHTDALKEIFGSTSIESATKLLLRVMRAKGRVLYPESPSVQPFRQPVLQSTKRRGKKAKGCRRWVRNERNCHHLTPKSRRGQPYYDKNESWNKLFIKIGRHNKWHDTFGVRTLEEIIRILMKCRRVEKATASYIAERSLISFSIGHTQAWAVPQRQSVSIAV